MAWHQTTLYSSCLLRMRLVKPGYISVQTTQLRQPLTVRSHSQMDIWAPKRWRIQIISSQDYYWHSLSSLGHSPAANNGPAFLELLTRPVRYIRGSSVLHNKLSRTLHSSFIYESACSTVLQSCWEALSQVRTACVPAASRLLYVAWQSANDKQTGVVHGHRYAAQPLGMPLLANACTMALICVETANLMKARQMYLDTGQGLSIALSLSFSVCCRACNVQCRTHVTRCCAGHAMNPFVQTDSLLVYRDLLIHPDLLRHHSLEILWHAILQRGKVQYASTARKEHGGMQPPSSGQALVSRHIGIQ